MAAVCHGPPVLASAEVPGGRTCTCYPAVGPDIKRVGAHYVELPWDRALVDGNLVTAPGWGAIGDWIGKFRALLGTKITP